VRNIEHLKQLAEEHGVKLTKRLFIEDRESGETRFFDVEKSRGQLTDELRDLGVIP
jgi:hypothetical protein